MDMPTTRKRLRVFLCSTKFDLDLERKGVSKVIQFSRHDELAMELFGAQPTAPIDTCLSYVARCDLMIVIIGFRYGSIVPRMRISFSEAEYRHGYALQKPCRVYFRKDAPENPEFVDTDPANLVRLQRWKRVLALRHTPDYFEDAIDLVAKVGTGLPVWVHESTGHRKATERDSAYLARQQSGHLEAVWVYAPRPLETLPDGSHDEIRRQVLKNLLAGVRYVYFVESSEGVERIALLAERLAHMAAMSFQEALVRINSNIEVCVLDELSFLTHYTVHFGPNGGICVFQSVLEINRRDRITKLSPPVARATCARIAAVRHRMNVTRELGLHVRRRP
jgi:uncharacterized protein DUF4062